MDSETLRNELSQAPAQKSNGHSLILAVDDEPVALYARSQLLKSAGYGVLCAHDGVQALQIFASNHVDLVLLDYRMPGMDGGIVAREIKQCKPELPVILTSATDVPDDALMWVNCFVTKAEDPSSLLQKIRQLLPPDTVPMPNQNGSAA